MGPGRRTLPSMAGLGAKPEAGQLCEARSRVVGVAVRGRHDHLG